MRLAQMSSALVSPGSRSVSSLICTGTRLVFVTRARNGTAVPGSGATSASWYAPSPLASFVLTSSTLSTGGGATGVVTAEVSSAVAVRVGLVTSATVTEAVLTLAAALGAGA